MRNLKQFVISLLITLFLGCYGGLTLFRHAHEVNGCMIIHSHPYSGNAASPHHSHSSQQIQLIDQLMHMLFFACSFFALLFFNPQYRVALRSVAASFPDKPLRHLLRLRGPPIH